MKIELTKEQVEKIIQLMESSTIQMGFAEEALKLLKKFKEAKE